MCEECNKVSILKTALTKGLCAQCDYKAFHIRIAMYIPKDFKPRIPIILYE